MNADKLFMEAKMQSQDKLLSSKIGQVFHHLSQQDKR